MDNFNLRKYLAEGKLHEEQVMGYAVLINGKFYNNNNPCKISVK